MMTGTGQILLLQGKGLSIQGHRQDRRPVSAVSRLYTRTPVSPSDDTQHAHVGDMGECLLLLKAPVQKSLLLAFQFPWKDRWVFAPSTAQ